MLKREEIARKECKGFLCFDLERDTGETISKEKLEEAWAQRYEDIFNKFYSEDVSAWRLYVALKNEVHFR